MKDVHGEKVSYVDCSLRQAISILSGFHWMWIILKQTFYGFDYCNKVHKKECTAEIAAHSICVTQDYKTKKHWDLVCVELFFLKTERNFFSIVSMNNRQNRWQSILSIVQPLIIDIMVDNNWLLFLKRYV